MKTLRFLVGAVAAVLLLAVISACDKVKIDYGVVVLQKKLVQIVVSGYDDNVYNFHYDKDGKLFFVTGDENNVIAVYDWSKNRIGEARANNDGGYRVNSLNDNMVTRIDREGGHFEFTYEAGRLKKENTQLEYEERFRKRKVSASYEYEWKGDKLLNRKASFGGKNTYKYDGEDCNGFMPPIFSGERDFLKWVHPELFGIRTSEMPDTFITTNNNGVAYSYLYKYYDDGYVMEATALFYIDDSYYAQTYTFIWE